MSLLPMRIQYDLLMFFLPLIVIISEIGVASGAMPPDRAAILVCAGMLSVLLFPILAVRLKGKVKWL